MADVRLASPQGKWILLTTVLGSSMAMVDSTVVNVALPRMGRDLDADLAALQWTVNAYMLTLAGLILLGGALGDRFGRRRVFVVGVVWFAAASLLCGLAPDAGVLIAARALQGVGGALLTPGSLALIQASFHPDDRARAVGLWSGFGGIGAAVGPFLGGWLVDGPGWRWVFLLNVPLALLCVPIAVRHVPESGDGRTHGRGFDVLGATLGALSLAFVTYALIEAATGSVPVVVTAVAGVAAGVAFVQVERRRPDPMMPPEIFASRQFTAVNIVTLFVYAAFGGFFFLAALQLQVVSGYSALAAGTALLPITVLMLLLSSRAGALGERIGPRIPLTVGPLLCAAGVLLMLRVGPGASYPTDVLPALLVMGLGMVTLVAPLTATVLASVSTEHAGLASGINNAAARAAGLIAVAALPLIAGMGPEAYRDP
ncbi:MAG TPA: MFS transporter, partial [Acidimicrobiales bacterium]|nr:MFS transporter [Acidimicrobiales bacterium]